MSAVSCITFIKRGVAKRHPDRVKLEAEDLKRLITHHGEELKDLEASDSDSCDQPQDDGADEEPNVDGAECSKGQQNEFAASKPKNQDDTESESSESEADSDEDVTKKYGLDEYDDDENKADDPLRMEGLTTFPSDKDDPYLNSDVDSEAAEIEIMPDDSLIAVAKVQGDYNTLEVYVYEESESNMYCHHDNLLPTFPLAMEWLDFDPSEAQTANLLALGSMQPDIEIWDLDLIDAMEPAFVLAGASKKKGKKKKKISTSGHNDAVLTLSWNRNHRQMLASGSADWSVLLWDLAKGSVLTSIAHEEKVQSIEWHPVECQSLLTGSFDKTVNVYDCRTPDEANKRWMLSGEVEQVKWNKHDPYYFLATTDDGNVSYIDVRNTEPIVTWKAHDSSATGVAVDPNLPGCVLTISSDKTMKVWDVRKEIPEMVLKKNMHMGELHCIDSCPDSTLVYAVGGEREHRIINLKKNTLVGKSWNLTVQSGDEDVNAPKVNENHSDEDSDEDNRKNAAAAKLPSKKKSKKQKKQKQ